MAPISTTANFARNATTGSRQGEILQSLVSVAVRQVNGQFATFSTHLIQALTALTEKSGNIKELNFASRAIKLLKTNGHAFAYHVMEDLAKLLRREIEALEHGFKYELTKSDGALSLVPYEEIESKVQLGTMGRPFEAKNADQLAELNIRLGFLMEREAMTTSQNPFRPEIFLMSVKEAWYKFDPDLETQSYVLPLLGPDTFLDLASVLLAVNDALKAKGVLPGSVESFRIKKTSNNVGNNTVADGDRTDGESALSQQIRNFLAPPQPEHAAFDRHSAAFEGQALQAAAASRQLFGFLAEMQERVAHRSGANDGFAAAALKSQLTQLGSPAYPHNVVHLPKIKEQAPKGSLSQLDENTIDLLTKIFETVFVDQNIPQDIKELIGLLQFPVLKAALIDKNFFYQEAHPARRLIELLTRAGMGWDERRAAQGPEDQLFEAMKRNVARIQQETDQQTTPFSDAVSDLESLIKDEEAASVEAISEPITNALKREKLIQSTKAAKSEVALRVGTGEVVAFIETFLEDKWVPVLTLAYNIEDEKPGVVKSAIKTMDDLIWSVKPKITALERKELIAKLPALLSTLNKWLNVMKWDDAERLQFFAELAECHASIVRAPLDLSPERQVEIAITVAQQAAERRMEKQAAAQAVAHAKAEREPEPVADESDFSMDDLQRGMWMEFLQKNDTKRKVKLAWVSPLRTLFIFSTSQRQETFSVSAEDLALALRSKRAQVVRIDGVVDRALSQALGKVAVNDEKIAQSA